MLLDLYIGFSGGRYGGLVFLSLEEFSTVCYDPYKDFNVVNDTEVNVFLEFPYFFYDRMDVGNLISGTSAFSKSSLYIWKFLVHLLLKPHLKDFEKEESEKVGLKFNIQKTKIIASGRFTSWEIDGETVEIVSDFTFLGSKVTADGDYSHEIKRRLLLGRKVMTNLDSVLKGRGITLPTKAMVKAMVFPVVMYGCESWTVKKAEC